MRPTLREWPQYNISIHVKTVFDGSQGFVTDDMFNFTCILTGSILADAKADQKTGENGVPFENLGSDSLSVLGQEKKTVLIHSQISALLEQTDSAADTGFRITHVFCYINTANIAAFLREKIYGFQIHFSRFLQMHDHHLRGMIPEYTIYAVHLQAENKQKGRGERA